MERWPLRYSISDQKPLMLTFMASVSPSMDSVNWASAMSDAARDALTKQTE